MHFRSTELRPDERDDQDVGWARQAEGWGAEGMERVAGVVRSWVASEFNHRVTESQSRATDETAKDAKFAKGFSLSSLHEERAGVRNCCLVGTEAFWFRVSEPLTSIHSPF